jgi:hypothetical protein
MSLFVKLFFFAMFIAFAMAQLPAGLPIPEGIIPAGIPGLPGGDASEAPPAEAKKF